MHLVQGLHEAKQTNVVRICDGIVLTNWENKGNKYAGCCHIDC